MFVKEKAKGEVKELDAASKLLLAAADFLENHQLCKGEFAFRNSYCMMGALRMVATGDPWNPYSLLLNIARERLRAKLGPNDGPAQWNDEPDRTKAEVVAMMRAVAFSS